MALILASNSLSASSWLSKAAANRETCASVEVIGFHPQKALLPRVERSQNARSRQPPDNRDVRTSNFRFEGYAGSLFVDAAFWTDLGRATSKSALTPCRTYSYGDGEGTNRTQPAGVIGTFLCRASR